MQPAMGACGSKVAQWREEAEEEWKAGKQQEQAAPAPLPQPLLRLPHDAPASYVPPLPPPTHPAGEEGLQHDQSVQFAFRKSQELSMGEWGCAWGGRLCACLLSCRPTILRHAWGMLMLPTPPDWRLCLPPAPCSPPSAPPQVAVLPDG